MKVRRCSTCRCELEEDEKGLCVDCKGVMKNIALVHQKGHGTHSPRSCEEELAIREERLLRRGRVGC